MAATDETGATLGIGAAMDEVVFAADIPNVIPVLNPVGAEGAPPNDADEGVVICDETVEAGVEVATWVAPKNIILELGLPRALLAAGG